METGTYKLSPESVDLGCVLGKVRRDSDLGARPKGVSIELHLPEIGARVRGEELLCYSLFRNLVRNAVDASPVDGRVRVEVETMRPA